MKIVLIGYMGSGKTTVAKSLSSFLKLPLVEMDECVFEKTDTKNMHEVFTKGGELLLRETEIAIAREYAFVDNIVISTGGGVVLNKITLDYLKTRDGKVFFLNASHETINNRLIDNKERPLFTTIEEMKSLYDFRKPLYFKYADKVIVADKKSVDEITEEIADHYLKGV